MIRRKRHITTYDCSDDIGTRIHKVNLNTLDLKFKEVTKKDIEQMRIPDWYKNNYAL